MALMDDMEAAVSTVRGAGLVHCEDADRADSARNEETANVTETAKHANEDTRSLTAADSVDNTRDESADSMCTEDSADCADVTNSRNMEIGDSTDCGDHSSKGASNDSESDCESSGESTCLEAMTPDGQDYYLRLGDTPQRRSALRLSRIIARKQLLRRLAQGSYGEDVFDLNSISCLSKT